MILIIFFKKKTGLFKTGPYFFWINRLLGNPFEPLEHKEHCSH